MDEWDSVLDVEQDAVQAGSSEGTAAGAEQGRFDGFYAGAMKGVELGAELGSYQGFAAQLLQPEHVGDVKPKYAPAVTPVHVPMSRPPPPPPPTHTHTHQFQHNHHAR